MSVLYVKITFNRVNGVPLWLVSALSLQWVGSQFPFLKCTTMIDFDFALNLLVKYVFNTVYLSCVVHSNLVCEFISVVIFLQ